MWIEANETSCSAELKKFVETKVETLSALISEVKNFKHRIESATAPKAIERTALSMQHWVNSNPTLQIHMKAQLADLMDSLRDFELEKSDQIDLAISQYKLVETMRICLQIFDIELDIIESAPIRAFS